MKSFINRLIWLVQRRRKEAELREELQFHLEEEAEDRLHEERLNEDRRHEGTAPEQARWAARRDLGNVTLLQEQIRAVWIWTFWEQLIQDVRYAVRMMLANKTFSALAV